MDIKRKKIKKEPSLDLAVQAWFDILIATIEYKKNGMGGKNGKTKNRKQT